MQLILHHANQIDQKDHVDPKVHSKNLQKDKQLKILS